MICLLLKFYLVDDHFGFPEFDISESSDEDPSLSAVRRIPRSVSQMLRLTQDSPLRRSVDTSVQEASEVDEITSANSHAQASSTSNSGLATRTRQTSTSPHHSPQREHRATKVCIFARTFDSFAKKSQLEDDNPIHRWRIFRPYGKIMLLRHWSEFVVEDGLGDFPVGWEQRFTENGTVYFVDHINRTTTV